MSSPSKSPRAKPKKFYDVGGGPTLSPFFKRWRSRDFPKEEEETAAVKLISEFSGGSWESGRRAVLLSITQRPFLYKRAFFGPLLQVYPSSFPVQCGLFLGGKIPPRTLRRIFTSSKQCFSGRNWDL